MEAERVLVAEVRIPFFGREDHGVSLFTALERECALQFGGERVELELVSMDEVE